MIDATPTIPGWAGMVECGPDYITDGASMFLREACNPGWLRKASREASRNPRNRAIPASMADEIWAIPRWPGDRAQLRCANDGVLAGREVTVWTAGRTTVLLDPERLETAMIACPFDAVWLCGTRLSVVLTWGGARVGLVACLRGTLP